MKKYSFTAMALAALLILSACGKKTDASKNISHNDISAVETVNPAKDDYYTDIPEGKATEIVFSESGITFDNAPVDGATVEITKGGTYILTGKAADAQVIISAPDRKTVRLVLGGVDLTSSVGAPIYTKSEAKTVISLADNTVNTLSDAPGLKDTKVTAALYCTGDLTINGGGTLNVYGKTNDAITSRGVAKIMSGTLNTDSAKTGIVAADGFIMQNGSLSIKASDGGIKTLNGDSRSLGYIELFGGSISISSVSDAIYSANTIYCSDGTLSLTTSGDAEPRAVYAERDMKISGGSFNIAACDDAVRAGGGLLIDGGSLDISSGNHALSAAKILLIRNGTTDVISSLCGLCSEVIAISGGDTRISASEDGISAESDDEKAPCAIRISDGSISVSSAENGIDSDGSIMMSGGTLVISGPVDTENNTLDYDDKFEISGGTLIASGSSKDVKYPSDTSRQRTAVLTFKDTVPAGSNVTLRDELGNVAISNISAERFSTILISSEQFAKGNKYSVFLGDMKLGEFKIDGKITAADAAQTKAK